MLLSSRAYLSELASTDKGSISQSKRARTNKKNTTEQQTYTEAISRSKAAIDPQHTKKLFVLAKKPQAVESARSQERVLARLAQFQSWLSRFRRLSRFARGFFRARARVCVCILLHGRVEIDAHSNTTKSQSKIGHQNLTIDRDPHAHTRF